MNTLDKSIWENRRTTRLFSNENREIPKEDLEYIATVINNTPSQCSIKSHFWMYLGESEEDMKFREWLVDNVYWTPDDDNNIGTNGVETMLAVIQAPAVLVCVRTSSPWANPEEEKTPEDHKHLADRSEGFVSGVILATLLNMGYKVATFGCTAGAFVPGNHREVFAEFTNMVKERFGSELKTMIDTYPGKQGNWDDINFFPGITQSFGPEGIDKEENFNTVLETWTGPSGKEYKFINGAKTRTPVDSTVGF